MTMRVYVSCDAAAQSVGANDVADAIVSTAADNGYAIDIVRTGTRGMLWLEPLIEVEVNGVRHGYGPVSVNDVEGLFVEGFIEGADHPLSLGNIEELPFLANQERLTFARCGIIDPLSIEDYIKHGGLIGMETALAKKPEEVVQVVSESGLRGRGGAGFPTGVKWETARKQKAPQKYICCNADEGDSGTFADRMLMEGDPSSIIEGMVIAGQAVGATVGYIYIRSEYPHAIKTMRAATKVWQDAGLLKGGDGDSKLDFELHVRVGAGAYICGEESSMLDSLEGKRGQVRVKPPIPAIEGLFGKPTIVNNVLTLASVPTILARGASYYKEFGVGRSQGTQPFQLAGDIARGGLVEKAFGVTLRELIEDFGGGTLSRKPIRAVQAGGPLGSYIPPAQFDAKMGYEELAGIGAMLGHGGIVVFNESVDMAQQAKFAMEFCEIESCGKCTPCRIGSTRGKETIDRIIDREDVDANIEILGDLCDLMETASLCAMGGLTPMPVKSALKFFPEDFGIPQNADLLGQTKGTV